jgi:hypothetical protein
MKHLYQSIAEHDHRIYIYKGQVEDDDAIQAAEYYSRAGCDAMPDKDGEEDSNGECPHGEGHKILLLDSYKGERIYEDGSLHEAA